MVFIALGFSQKSQICRVLLSFFHSKIVISNSNNTLILLHIWKRVFLFVTLWLLEVIASLTCLIVDVNRHFERGAQTACCSPDLKERLPSVHEPPRADPNKETGRRCSSAARVHSAHRRPSAPAHQIFTIYGQSGWPHVCQKISTA